MLSSLGAAIARLLINCIKNANMVGQQLAIFALLLSGFAQLAAAGSCREAQLCCSGRDSSCVVQKAPINAIIEDLSDKPCYCDHACLKLGDCCTDFKDHCGVRDCQVSAWGQWSECDTSCGTGIMSRTRQILQPAQNGGKHCPSLVQKRGCQGSRCHGYHDKRLLHEMALLLPAALSRNRHANDSSDIRRNLRLRYRDLYKHNRKNEYCIEFEVIKATKACSKLPPYNLMQEGDRITARCDLEALIQDIPATTTTSNNNNKKKHIKLKYNKQQSYNKIYNETNPINPQTFGDPVAAPSTSSDADNNDNDSGEADAENMLDSGSYEMYDYMRAPASSNTNNNSGGNSITTTLISSTTTTTTAATTTPAISYHCRGEGVAGRTTRWSALASPSCRGKWLRLTVGAPKKCTHAQFIFV